MVPKKYTPLGVWYLIKTKGLSNIIVDLKKNINIFIPFGTQLYLYILLCKPFRHRKPSPRTRNLKPANLKTIFIIDMSLVSIG